MLDLDAKYEVVIFSIGDTKAGTKMGKLQVKNLNDESIMNCILWEEALNRLDAKIFKCGNIIKIISGTFNEKFNNCLVSNLELVEEAKAGLDEEEREEKFKYLLQKVEGLSDVKLKEFVTGLLFEYEEQFKTAPAAKLMHHNYLGGLLQHTAECVEIAQNFLNSFPTNVDKDTVIAACVLHDFGKIFEYDMDFETGLIDYNEEFKKDWISHSQWGYTKCMQQGFKTIAKMIATHHGRIEWGAMVDLNERDLEPILYIVHHIDDLSAKFGKISVTDL